MYKVVLMHHDMKLYGDAEENIHTVLILALEISGSCKL